VVHTPEQRRRLGAWYTPDHIVDQVVAAALHGATPQRVLDPACGDGRFLAAVREALLRQGIQAHVCGVDIDPAALDAARQRLGPDAELIAANALDHVWGDRRFDLVIGNPPFLSPLTAGNISNRHTGAQYADTAVAFWVLAHELAEPGGGRVAFVLPVSVLASRDAGPARSHIAQRAAWRWWWWAERPVFPDAQVLTGALVTELGGEVTSVARQLGPTFQPGLPVHPPVPSTSSWGWLVADTLGMPALPSDYRIAGEVGDRADVRGDFRDQYYGLVGSVVDDGDGPPLVTSGLIDPGRCWWGERPVRFAGQRYQRPTVDVANLNAFMQGWVAKRSIPKVLVASQTRIIEAVADHGGTWLPGVPVISVIPRNRADVAAVAAVLSSPFASRWLAQRSAGTGRSAHVVRVSAPVLAQVPWPQGSVNEASDALRDGDLVASAHATSQAYGLDGAAAQALFDWWSSALPRRAG
jgi:SAM-dependent methyltransferase